MPVTKRLMFSAPILKETLKKALSLSAFFVFVFFSSLNNLANAEVCSSANVSASFENAQVKWVYDADTLLLNDKRKIRLIGIDAPEVKHHRQKSQPYGAKAREALRALLKKYNYKIQLRFGKEKADRYKRTLAHVFLEDGTNVSNWLLERGFARTLTIPPNVKLAACYKQTERVAQQKQLRLWGLKTHRLRHAESLPLAYKGYVRLNGSVHRVVHKKRSLTIELVGKSKLPIHIKVRKKNLRYFKDFNIADLKDKYITVTGMINKRYGKRILYLSHPSQLEITPKNQIRTLH